MILKTTCLAMLLVVMGVACSSEDSTPGGGAESDALPTTGNSGGDANSPAPLPPSDARMSSPEDAVSPPRDAAIMQMLPDAGVAEDSGMDSSEPSKLGMAFVSPMEFDFGATAINKAMSKTLTVSNLRLDPLMDIKLSIAGANVSAFRLDPWACVGDVLPNQTCLLKVIYVPDALGNQSAKLVVTALSGFAAEISLSGLGVANGQISFQPDSIQFLPALLNKPSTQKATLKNNASFGVLPKFSLAGDKGDFAVSDTCQKLDAGQTCEVLLTFTPVHQGKLIGKVVVDAGAAGVATLSVSGQGIGAHLDLTPDRHDFGNVNTANVTTKLFTVTVKNLLTFEGISDLGISLPPGFMLASNGCAQKTLKNEQSCSFAIAASFAAKGPIQGLVSVSSGPLISVAKVSANAASPPAKLVGDWLLDTSLKDRSSNGNDIELVAYGPLDGPALALSTGARIGFRAWGRVKASASLNSIISSRSFSIAIVMVGANSPSYLGGSILEFPGSVANDLPISIDSVKTNGNWHWVVTVGGQRLVSVAADDGATHKLIVTFDGARLRLTIDNRLDNEMMLEPLGAVPTTVNTMPLILGGGLSNGTVYGYSGDIQSVVLKAGVD
jgi:hypothetical protein